jgi:hypothetical protein
MFALEGLIVRILLVFTPVDSPERLSQRPHAALLCSWGR